MRGGGFRRAGCSTRLRAPTAIRTHAISRAKGSRFARARSYSYRTCSDDGERCTGVERGLYRDMLIERGEQDRAGEHAQSIRKVIEAERLPASPRRDETDDPRAFRAFAQRERNRIEDEQDDEKHERMRRRKHEVDDRVREPAGDQQMTAI